MEHDADMKYTDTHEWIAVQSTEGTVGISTHAQAELGEVVYVQLPKIGSHLEAGEEAAVIESTKAASDIYSPISGIVVAINEKVRENPSLINSSAEADGWLFKISVENRSELDSLLDHPQYLQLIS